MKLKIPARVRWTCKLLLIAPQRLSVPAVSRSSRYQVAKALNRAQFPSSPAKNLVLMTLPVDLPVLPRQLTPSDRVSYATRQQLSQPTKTRTPILTQLRRRSLLSGEVQSPATLIHMCRPCVFPNQLSTGSPLLRHIRPPLLYWPWSMRPVQLMLPWRRILFLCLSHSYIA
jgi:hypothetical protein